MAIKTEMISIAMPQPVETFQGFISSPILWNSYNRARGDLGPGSPCQMDTLRGEWPLQLLRTSRPSARKGTVLEVILGHSSEGPRGGGDQVKKEGVSSTDHQSRSPSLGSRGAKESKVGLRGLRDRMDSPCRAGMAFHTDTGPWLANWPSDTSKKKMGNPARASIIR